MNARTRMALAAAAATALGAAGGATAIAARPTGGATYRGQDDGCVGQCTQVTLKVARTGRTLRAYVDGWEGTCKTSSSQDGLKAHNVFTESTATARVRLRSNGRFTASGAYNQPPPKSYAGPPAKSGRVTFSITGRFTSAGRAVGRYTGKVVLRNASGARTDTCATSSKWTAKRG